MKGRAIIPLVIGLAIGVFAIRSFLNVLSKAKGSGPTETVQVVRASADIAPTVEITAEMLETVAIPESLVPEGASTDLEKVVGRVTTNMIPAGILVVPALLAPEGTLPGMSSRVPMGYRAVAIQVDEIKGVGGWLYQGCRVDVVMVAETENRGRRQGTISKIVLQDVEVLAVGLKEPSDVPKASVSRSVTVLVRPEDATKLALAASKGKLQLTMRNSTDDSRERIITLTENDLLQDKPPDQALDNRSGTGKQTFLGGLFGKDSKIDGERTDKQDAEPSVVAKPAPVQVAAAPQSEWIVKVLSGPQAYRVRFDSDGQNARQITGQQEQGRPVGSSGSVGGSGPQGGVAHWDFGGSPSSDKDRDEEDRDAPLRE